MAANKPGYLVIGIVPNESATVTPDESQFMYCETMDSATDNAKMFANRNPGGSAYVVKTEAAFFGKIESVPVVRKSNPASA